MIHPFTQGHLLSMVAPATILTGIGWVDFDSRSSSFFRFGEQLVKKSRPCRVLNAFGKTMVMGHSVDVKVFNTDHIKPINDLAALLVREVITPEGDTLMDSCHNLAVLATLRRTPGQFGVRALHFRKGFLFRAEKARIGYLFSIGESGKGFQAHINPYLGIKRLKAFRFTLTRKADVPFAGTGPMNGTRLDFSFERPVIDHLD